MRTRMSLRLAIGRQCRGRRSGQRPPGPAPPLPGVPERERGSGCVPHRGHAVSRGGGAPVAGAPRSDGADGGAQA